MDLRAMEHKLEDKKQQTTILREDCTSLADKISTMSEGDRYVGGMSEGDRYVGGMSLSLLVTVGVAMYMKLESRNERHV